MTISVGDRIPSVDLTRMTADGPQAVSTDELCAGRKVVLFAVPGAFTPTCSAQHLPGFTANVDALRAKGVDAVACLATNDVFVMDAWGKDQDTDGKVEMLADGSGEFTKAMGLEFDLSARGLGVRSQRYALVADDGVVTTLNVDEGGGLEKSSAESILAAL
ncbi:MAG: peroxiredoxin [Immundisolibacterales bacterium]|nr:peroxiredoxin [Immundisolibacterales bacterium]